MSLKITNEMNRSFSMIYLIDKFRTISESMRSLFCNSTTFYLSMSQYTMIINISAGKAVPKLVIEK